MQSITTESTFKYNSARVDWSHSLGFMIFDFQALCDQKLNRFTFFVDYMSKHTWK